ncbi:TetR family transcriptional regulator [Nocardia brasiliensis]|uniref:TetR family transcriptional regulator n=2 Tax=Nocardia brasiliensis TaxID=37326 RepID=A0A6G9Y474_NOCBR|nr:TetR family transcriptional regulator [Nocardia brasiliensis]
MKRSDATKQALLRAARNEFAAYGLAGARVDRIAEAAGVNKERIYGLFGSKDKLFDVILIDTMREFMDVVQPLTETDPGRYVAKLFDYHNNNPQLLRLLLWEGLHRGVDAHDIDGWRAQNYERKFARAIDQFGVDARFAGHLLLALCGMSNWSLAVPQTTRLLLGAAAEDKDATREFMQEFARAAMRNFPRDYQRREPAGALDAEPVNGLTTESAHRSATAQARATATDPETPLQPGISLQPEAALGPEAAVGPEPAVSPEAAVDLETSLDPEAPLDPDTAVDRAARRLREAQAAAEAARAELAEALRDAHATGASANQLARRVSGTLSRPVVLKLLAD